MYASSFDDRLSSNIGDLCRARAVPRPGRVVLAVLQTTAGRRLPGRGPGRLSRAHTLLYPMRPFVSEGIEGRDEASCR